MLGGEAEIAQDPQISKLSEKLMIYQDLQPKQQTPEHRQSLRYYADSGALRRAAKSQAYALWLRGELESHPEFETDSKYGFRYFKGFQINDDDFKMWDEMFAVTPPAPKGLFLYRGEVLPSIENLPRVGQVFQGRSLISTSIDPSVAKEFSVPRKNDRNYTDQVVRVRNIIECDPSVKAINMAYEGYRYNVTNQGARPISPNILREEEFLLHPQTHFTVRSVKKSQDEHGVFYEVKLTAASK